MCALHPDFTRRLTAILAVSWVGFAPIPALRAAEAAVEPVRFVEPELLLNSTNSMDEADRSPSLRGLNSTIRKPFSLFNASDAFSRNNKPTAPQRAPLSPAELKRLKEVQDRKKNWAFLTPEEIYGVQTPEDILSAPEFGPDGQRLEPLTAIERFVARLEGGRSAAATNQASSDSLSIFADLKEADAPENGEKPLFNFMANPALQAVTPGGSPPYSGAFMSRSTDLDAVSGQGGDFEPPQPLDSAPANDALRANSWQDFKKMLEARPATSLPPANSGVGVATTIAPPPTFSLGNPPAAAGPLGGLPTTSRPALTAPTAFGVAPGFTPAFSPSPEVTTPTRRHNAMPVTAFELPKRKY